MQKILLVLILSLLALAAQLLCFSIFGAGLVPNFMLIVVVFFNLYRGLRLSLGAAFWGGFLLDSYSGNILGINTLTFVICAFLTGSLKMYLYQPGVAESRTLVVFVIVLVNGFLHYLVLLVSGVDMRLGEAFWRVIVPEVILTAFIANETLARLKACALKLSV